MNKITGAGYRLFSDEARKASERMYASIRNRKLDCYYISKNTPFSIEQVQVIKNYIFKDSHWLLDNGQYVFERFYPAYDIADSWLRLAKKDNKDIKQHDIMLLYHELTEIMTILNNPGYTQDFAHELANKKYNYQNASIEYYSKLGRV